MTFLIAILTVVSILAYISLVKISLLLSAIVDVNKGTLRMEDVERAKVYSEHLGKKLSS